MKIKYFLELVLLFTFLNTNQILAIGYFYYFKNEQAQQEVLQNKEYRFKEDFSVEEKIYFLIENILNNDKNMINYIPKDSRLININLNSGNLILNFTKEIKNYGGSHFELNFIKQILANCFQFKEVETVTFLIENKLDYLTEGSLIYKERREN